MGRSEGRSTRAVVVCDAGSITDPDLGTVDALARLRLAARRAGYELRLARVPPQLTELVDLAGLSTALGAADGLAVESVRQPEEWEEGLGVEEEADAADPPR